MSVWPTSSPKITRIFGFFASAAYVARGDRSAPIVRAKRIAARVNADLPRLSSLPRRCIGSISAPICIALYGIAATAIGGEFRTAISYDCVLACTNSSDGQRLAGGGSVSQINAWVKANQRISHLRLGAIK